MQISILGCGWLGLPLAKALLAEGHLIKGSTTTKAKLDVLRQEGIEPFLILLSETGPVGNITGFLEKSDVLIIDVPPKLRCENSESYVEKIKSLVPHIENSGIRKMLFVSSTSVYADEDSIVTEDTIPNPETESGRQLAEAEKLLQGSAALQATILRFAGLIGEDRHPVKHMAGKKGLANPDAPVNLIHLEDCIGIISAIIEKNAWGQIFNGAAPHHPTRKKYYTQKATELGLEAPCFNESQAFVCKTVLGEKVSDLLHYTFKYTLADGLH